MEPSLNRLSRAPMLSFPFPDESVELCASQTGRWLKGLSTGCHQPDFIWGRGTNIFRAASVQAKTGASPQVEQLCLSLGWKCAPILCVVTVQQVQGSHRCQPCVWEWVQAAALDAHCGIWCKTPQLHRFPWRTRGSPSAFQEEDGWSSRLAFAICCLSP